MLYAAIECSSLWGPNTGVSTMALWRDGLRLPLLEFQVPSVSGRLPDCGGRYNLAVEDSAPRESSGLH